MMKFGYSMADIEEFFIEFNKYNFFSQNRDNQQNKYALNIQIKLIDMFFLKRKVISSDDSDLRVFLALLSTLDFMDAIDYLRD